MKNIKLKILIKIFFLYDRLDGNEHQIFKLNSELILLIFEIIKKKEEKNEAFGNIYLNRIGTNN